MSQLTREMLDEIKSKVGSEVTDTIKGKLAEYDSSLKAMVSEAVKNGGGISEETFKAYKEKSENTLGELKTILEKQGLQLSDLIMNGNDAGTKGKDFATVVKAAEKDLADVFRAKSGSVDFMLTFGKNGEVYARRFDETAEQKTAGITGTIDGLSGGGTVSSIAQSIGAAELLRMGGNSPIISQYRNSSYLMNLINTTTAGFAMPFAMWIDEQPKEGASATTAEGGAKPLVQYLYSIKTAPYKKESALLTITDEFNLDLPRLQSDLQGKAVIDLGNRIQSAILANVKSATTAYTDVTDFLNGTTITAANEFDVITAMSAKVANDTYGANANAALLNTYTQNRMGILKDMDGAYLNPPSILSGISFIGNPEIAVDEAIVGDFSQYNCIMRGGLIMRMGYNADDFSKGRFSVSLDQFYFDYISDIRKKALVKGTLSTLKAALAGS